MRLRKRGAAETIGYQGKRESGINVSFQKGSLKGDPKQREKGFGGRGGGDFGRFFVANEKKGEPRDERKREGSKSWTFGGKKKKKKNFLDRGGGGADGRKGQR